MSNIASGLCGSFVSRNNALDGYWSIGKLRTLADKHGQTTVLFEMLTLATQPPSSGIATLTARCYRLLAKLAELSRIPLEEVTVARIAVDFAPPPWPRARYYNDASPFMAWIHGCLLFGNPGYFSVYSGGRTALLDERLGWFRVVMKGGCVIGIKSP